MDSICQRLRQLFNRDRAPELPPPPAIDPLSDAGYERLYFKLLDRADEGWTRSQFLEQWDDRLEDKFFKSWLRRFGDKLLSSPAPNRELAQRMVHLGETLTPDASPVGANGVRPPKNGEEIANLSTEYGRKLLDRELSPLTPEEYEPTFKQLLQKTANGKAAVLAFLRDFEARVSVAQWCEWLPGYGERLLAVEEPDQTTAKALLRLGDILAENDDETDSNSIPPSPPLPLSPSSLGELATRIGQEMRDREIIWEVWEYEETIKNEKFKIQNGGDAGNAEDLLGQEKPLQRGDTMTLGELQSRAQQEWEQPSTSTNDDKEIASLNPETKEWLSQFAQHYQSDRIEEALTSLDRAIQLDSTNGKLWSARGELMAHLGRDEEAISSFDRALEINPGHHQSWSNRGNCLNNLGQYGEAISSCDRALEINPEHHQSWYNRGNSLLYLGQYKEAIVSYDRVIKIQPDSYSAWNNRGATLVDWGRYEEAILSCNRALEIEPNYREALCNLGNALYRLKRYEEAIHTYDRALKIKPDDLKIWNNRGALLVDWERYEEAILSCNRALEIEPNYHEAMCNLGNALHSLERYEEAIYTYDRALEIKLDYYEAWYNRGNSLDKLGRGEEALASCDRSLEIRLDYYKAWLLRGQVMGNLSNPVSVPTTLILKFSHLNRSGYEGRLNSYKEGLNYCQQDTHPEGWGLLHYCIGQVHYFLGRYDIRRRSYCQKAFESYNNALKTLTETAFPQPHLEVLQDLIKVLLALGEPEQAAEMRRRGSEVLRRLLANTPSEAVKQRLAFEFVSFQQYSVDLAVVSGDCEAAWELAEAGKNACLTWLLPEGGTIKNEKLKMKNGLFGDLLDSNTAAIYWHVSPAALTTFVLFCDRPAIVISSPSGDEVGEGENDRLSQLLDWEKWLSDWNEQYNDYATKDSNASKIHPWRVEMEANLQRLGEILNINAIFDCLGDRDRENTVQTDDRDRENTDNCDRENTENGDRENTENGDRANAVRPYNLILVPHRDLHRFPLHYFFGEFACTYLPSISFGLQQQRQPWNAIDRLLLAENPKAKPEFGNVKKSLAGLPFAEVEAALIEAIARENNSDVLRLEDNNTDKKITKDAIAIELIRSSEIHATEEKTDVGANGIRPTQSVAVPSENAIAQTQNKFDDRGFHFCGHGWYNSNDPANSCLFLNGDDRFTLYDIVNLDLSSYKIVSLAACETAVTGNQTITTEFVGLSSAFLSAGVRFTISTLWTVESAASAILMVEFYRQLQENPPAIALKTAQTWLQNATRQDLINWCEQNEPLLPGSLALILEDERDRLSKLEGDRPYSHPYFWAAFTVSGV